MSALPHLSVVKDPPPDAGGPPGAGPEVGDVALVGTLFVLNLVPVAGELVGLGRWSPAVVGFAAGAALLTGRELWSELRAAWRPTGCGRRA
jgi:hypothetical protein